MMLSSPAEASQTLFEEFLAGSYTETMSLTAACVQSIELSTRF
jgi:hypothetical protein